MNNRPQKQLGRNVSSPDFSKLERFALMKLLKHYNMNPVVGATHSELVAMVTKSFENTVVREHEVLQKFTHNLMRPADGSSKSKGGRHLRNHLDSEPAKIGEQVTRDILHIRCQFHLYICFFFQAVYVLCIRCSVFRFFTFFHLE